MSEQTKLVQIYAGSHPEAGYLQTMLEAEGIPAFLFDEMMATIAAPYIAPGGSGAVRVMIAEIDVGRAEPILTNFKSDSQTDEDER